MQRSVSDPGTFRAMLQAEVLLGCPRCHGCGISKTFDDNPAHLFAPRRFTCHGCGYSREWTGDRIERLGGEAALDDYFHYPLWLQTTCRHGVLWAYNRAHLEALAAWLETPLRARRRDPVTGWSNGSFLSRLPAWMKSARNRREVAAALDRLRALSAQTTQR